MTDAKQMSKTREQVCSEIAEDMANDATAFDGRPFNGRTVAEYFGNQGAAIAALARIVQSLLNEYDATTTGGQSRQTGQSQEAEELATDILRGSGYVR